MTQTANDPWAAAAMPQGNPAAGNIATPPAAAAAPTGSGLGDSYASPASTGSGLFGGEGQESLPALFNLLHTPGTEFRGKILTPPKAVQATCHPNASPIGQRQKQYWVTDSTGKRKPGLDEIDPRTSKPNDKVMNTVVELEISERFTTEQLQYLASNGREDYVDDGRRVWTVTGPKRPKGHKTGEPTNAMRAMLDAIEAAVKGGLRITCDEDMEDLFLTVRRVQREQPNVPTSSWTYLAKLEK
jgi:hypothetical protein